MTINDTEMDGVWKTHRGNRTWLWNYAQNLMFGIYLVILLTMISFPKQFENRKYQQSCEKIIFSKNLQRPLIRKTSHWPFFQCKKNHSNQRSVPYNKWFFNIIRGFFFIMSKRNSLMKWLKMFINHNRTLCFLYYEATSH